MAKKQTRRGTSINRKTFDAATTHAKTLGIPLSMYIERLIQVDLGLPVRVLITTEERSRIAAEAVKAAVAERTARREAKLAAKLAAKAEHRADRLSRSQPSHEALDQVASARQAHEREAKEDRLIAEAIDNPCRHDKCRLEYLHAAHDDDFAPKRAQSAP